MSYYLLYTLQEPITAKIPQLMFEYNIYRQLGATGK